MHKILLAALMGASVLAVPAFAQVYPAGNSAGTRSSSRVGVTATGAPANTGLGANADVGTAAGTPGTPALGLGDLLKQAQANDPNAAADAANDGADPTANPVATAKPREVKAHIRKSHSHEH